MVGAPVRFMGKREEELPPYNHTTQSLTPQVCPDLYTLAQAADSSTGCKLCRVGQQGAQRVGVLHSLRLLP